MAIRNASSGVGASLAVIALVGAVCANPAHAQQPPAVTASASTGDAEARRHFAQGEALFRRQNYAAALAEYQRAYDLLPRAGRRYVLLFNIGQCHERLFRYDAAVRFYRRFLGEAPAEATERAQVQARVDVLASLLATLRIRVRVRRAEVWVDQHRVGVAPGTVLVTGGQHVVELRAPGYLPARREVQVAAQETRALRFELERLSQARGASPVFFWSAAGAAVVAGGAGAILGVMALSARSDVDDRLADPDLRYDVGEDDRRQIQDLSLAADVLFGSAAVLAITAAVLLPLTDWGDRAASTSGSGDRASRLHLRGALGPRGARLVIGGEL